MVWCLFLTEHMSSCLGRESGGGGLFPAHWRPLQALIPVSLTPVGPAHSVDAQRRAKITPHARSCLYYDESQEAL